MKKHEPRRSRVSEYIRMISSKSDIQDEPLTTATAFSPFHEYPDVDDSQNLDHEEQVWLKMAQMNLIGAIFLF